jgi:hypothetical protein
VNREAQTSIATYPTEARWLHWLASDIATVHLLAAALAAAAAAVVVAAAVAVAAAAVVVVVVAAAAAFVRVHLAGHVRFAQDGVGAAQHLAMLG